MHCTLAYLSLTQWRLHVKHEDPDSEASGQQLKGKEFKSLNLKIMKVSETFRATIKAYLDKRAAEDALFRQRYQSTPHTIDDVVTYILNYVLQSGCNGFTDEEIFGLAVHVIDEPNIEIGKPVNARVVVNHHVELTEEEKAEQKKEALRRYQNNEYTRLSNIRTQSRAKAKKTVVAPSLFD